MRRRLGLLVVGHVDALAIDVGGDYPQLYRDLLGPTGVEVVPFACDEGQLPASLDDCDGWMCSPSRSSVYDDLPWLSGVEEVVRRIVAEERPFVGVCFGHQLLATALGGRVERAEVGWGLGAQSYEVVGTGPWMTTTPRTVTLLASHQDQVVEPPADSRTWLRADYCPYGGLVVGERAWTIQTHPEFTVALVDRLLAHRVELLGEEPVRRARAGLGVALDRELVAGWIARTLDPTGAR
jgi:GMP synthase-like glutamine amidotransferase